MASIAGPRIAEIKVRHHARQFGQSKYGLSRIYKVVLDLMVIKTIASFTPRPLLWFSMLALPGAILGTIMLGYAIWLMLSTWSGQAMPLAGSGVIFLASSTILFCSGAVGELVYNMGDMRESQFARLTRKLRDRQT
jgi:hypothetical protein